MTGYKSDFLATLHERGFIHQVSEPEKLDAAFKSGMVTAYVGYDATASSLHVGSLVSIMMLQWMQKFGHKPIVLMGGGTTRVGDPSGRDESRKLLDDAAIQSNIDGIKRIFSEFVTFGENGNEALMANNAEWLLELNYIDFLRDVGRHFSVNRMLSFESVKQRLDREQPLSFLEFNYMILQAYDYVELFRRYGCTLQMGGSDQWGNIVNGIDLGRRMEEAQLFALTCPLLTTASGAKMGKTASGAVWLNQEMLSAYDYWQYWRNTEDADVGRFLKLFTELPLDEIARLAALEGAEINEAKKVLATEATAMAHGRAVAEQAAQTAQKTFEQGAISQDLPTITLDLDAGAGLLTATVQAGFASSNSEARRAVQSGAVRINDAAVSDPMMTLNRGHLGSDGVIKLSMGKKRHALIRPA
ncbi:MAG: tyrosine--tRNA ligase [Rhodobiaceae bacterium]|nr:tyrosine--tRNA ligase [Rhodobiaceae bacterium]